MNRDILNTIAFMVFIFLILVGIMYATGVMDRGKEQAMQRAEFLCWKSGYYGGVDNFDEVSSYEGLNRTNGKAYRFTCKAGDFGAIIINSSGYVFKRS
jgi:hypothetical protein